MTEDAARSGSDRLSARASIKAATRSALQRLLRSAGLPELAWKAGLAEERWFWDTYLRTGGFRWPEEYRTRMDPEVPLQPHLAELIPDRCSDPVQILDVGSGPLTAIGKRWGERRLAIVAVDPLARWYEHLFDRYRIEPAVRPVECRAEALRALFGESTFDLVHARNCIDHGVDPPRAIQSMLDVVKPGGCVYLEHAVNEGKNERYRGLHQWNFFQGNDGDFHVGGRRGEINATRRFSGRAEITTSVGPDQWIRVILRKRRERGSPSNGSRSHSPG